MLIKSIIKGKFCLIDLVANYRVISLLIISFILNQSLAFSQNQIAKESPEGTWYYEYLPADYDENNKDYPIMFFFHGLGERGNSKGDLTKVTRNGPPKHVKLGHDFPFILISPQLKTSNGNWSPSYMDEVVEHVLNSGLRIDENRIYVTGLSLGGGGAWFYAQSFPEKIAAVAPVCGSRNSTSKAEDIAAENIPVWAFHGDADGVVPYLRTVNMVNAINAITPTISPKAKMSIYEGVGHNSWSNAYSTDNSIHSPNLYDWFMMQSKSTISVNAGNDKILNLPKNNTTISGSASSSDAISSYLWEKISGPSLTMTNTTKAKLSVSKLKNGVYKFRLTATDDNDNSAHDQMKLTVVESNSSPLADAGNNKQIVLPTNSISIYGSGSDSDGSISAYSWRKTSGGAATLNNTNNSKLKVSNLESGIYKFELTVTDNDNATHSDEMRLEVIDGENLVPMANAGGDITVQLPTNSTNLAGSGSDGDGTIVSYFWEKTSGPSATISNGDNSTATANNLVSGGVYTFRLTVTDDDGATDSDLKRITVVEANQVPTVSISDQEQYITLPTSTTNIQATASDPDGSIASYLWEIVSEAGASTLQNSTTSTLTVNDLNVTGQYVYSITVTDNEGVTNSDTATVNINEEDFNERPFVDAGRDQFIVLPENEVVLEGYASDPDGEIVSYFWKKVSGGNATLSGENTATLKATNLEEGIYHFRFTATDNDGAHKTHATYVEVKAEEYNIPPVVDAGTNKAIGSYKNFTTFNAIASDMDGEIVSYRWELISGENDFVWSGINTPTMELSELKVGIYKFQVTVEDDRGGLATDEVRLKVRDSNISFTKDDKYSDNPTIFELAQLSLVSDSILIENAPENASIRWFYEDVLQEQYNEKSKIPFKISGSYFVVVEFNG
ncbi:Ig-like domain-containing protein [Marivirga tractuosa]|uniref:PKD domain-containing protein n=1 Tax=Marivirga tractuosa TaxID=1006 RepID=UPI0035D1361B